jgi:hypothetical protein
MDKLTREFCKGKILLFHPETEAEAEFIQRSLFRMGFSWESGKTVPQVLKECCDTGLCLYTNGTLYRNPGENTRKNAEFCTSAQFDPPYGEAVVKLAADSNPMAVLLKEFNTMAGRLDRLTAEMTELKQEVAKFNAEIAPKHLLKDKF